MRTARVLVGDVREVLARLPSESVHCVVTSPPYWGLRDYGLPPSIWKPADLRGAPDCAGHEWGDEIKLHKGGPHGDGVMLGGSRSVIEAQAAVKDIRAGAFCFDLYVEHMVEVFREVQRVLRPDGTLWLNLGDCYATGAGAVGDCPGGGAQGARWASTGGTRGDGKPDMNGRGEPIERPKGYRGDRPPSGKHVLRKFATNTVDPKAAKGIGPMTQPNRMPQPGLKPKDLVGIPWRVAFALQADGWWLRSDVIWSKPNPMPESITDRPTKAHEYLFLLTKSERYFYDKDAILEPAHREASGNVERKVATDGERSRLNTHLGSSVPWLNDGTGRNRRSVWTIATQPFPGAHFATMPENLVEPCILAGTSEKGACAKCGTSWEREVESNNPSLHAADHDNALGFPSDGRTSNPQSSASLHRQKGGVYSTRVAKGWSPSCDCGEQQTRPCVVLDPFGGSGTVPTVALRLGREALMVDLNPDYVLLARDRIEGDASLLNRVRIEGAA